jgi:hypothetical protein
MTTARTLGYTLRKASKRMAAPVAKVAESLL